MSIFPWPVRVTIQHPIGMVRHDAVRGDLVSVGNGLPMYAGEDLHCGEAVVANHRIVTVSAHDGSEGFTLTTNKDNPSHWKEVEKLANQTAAALPWWAVRKRFYWARVAGHAAGQRSRILNGRNIKGLP